MSRASEKLATKNEIIKHENKGLRETIKLPKTKRKATKAMGLFNPEENSGQPVFFSPAKVELARQRLAHKEQAEEQRKQAIEDRRLQTAIAREEKAQGLTERKEQRAAARQALQERRAQEKAEREREREMKRVQKLEEASRQKEERLVRTAERLAIRQAKLQLSAAPKVGVRGTQRAGGHRENKGPRKRLHAIASPKRGNPATPNKRSNRKTSPAKNLIANNFGANSLHVVRRSRREPWVPTSQSLRSGRRTKPPSHIF